MNGQADGATAVTQEVPAEQPAQADGTPPSGNGAQGEAQPTLTPEQAQAALGEFAKQLTPDLRRALLKTSMSDDETRQWARDEFFGDDIQRESQRRADRRASDDWLTVRHGEIDAELLPTIDQAMNALAGEDGQAPKSPDDPRIVALRERITDWLGRRTRAGFEYAIRRSPIYSDLSPEEEAEINEARRRPDQERYSLVLATLLKAQDRITKGQAAAQGQQAAAQQGQFGQNLVELANILKGAQGQTGSAEIAGTGTGDSERLARIVAGDAVTDDDRRWWNERYGRKTSPT